MEKGIAIALDVLFALMLVSGVLLFFSEQPLLNDSLSQSFNRDQKTSRDVVDVLEKSGFLSVQLVDKNFSQESVEEIYNKALELLPKGTHFGMRVTQFDVASDLTECKDPALDLITKFNKCFPTANQIVFSSGSPLPAGTTGYVSGKKIFSKYRPTSDVGEMDPTACTAQANFSDGWDLNRLFDAHFAAMSGNVEFESSVVDAFGDPVTQLACNDSAILKMKVRNEARNPVALMLVMDRSGSMSQMDMNFRSVKGFFSGGLCARQIDDASGNDNNANNFHSAPAQLSGVVDSYAGDFNGNAFLEAPDAPTLRVNNFTFSAWVYPTSFATCGTTGGCTFAVKESSYLIGINNTGKVYYAINNSNGYQWYATSAMMPLNQWTHFSLTYDGSKIETYTNKQKDSVTVNESGLITHNSNPLYVGMRYPRNATKYGFVGYLDEVRLYNTNLHQNEINQVYFNNNPVPESLMARYTFEQFGNGTDASCFVKASTSIPVNTCGTVGVENPSRLGGFPPELTNVSTAGTFTVDQSEVDSLGAASQYEIVFDRGGASGTCSLISGSVLHKAPFMRIKKPDNKYFKYSSADMAYQLKTDFNAQTLGTHTIEIWNADNNAYVKNPPVVYARKSVVSQNLLDITAGGSAFESEAKGDFNLGSFPVSGVIFENSVCTTTSAWTPVTTVNVSDSNIYGLVFKTSYNKTTGCAPQFRVTGPTGSNDINLSCQLGNTWCQLKTWNRTRTLGSYAPTGDYTLWVNSDATMNYGASYYYEKYLSAANSGASLAARRCVYSGDWNSFGSFTITDEKTYDDAFYFPSYVLLKDGMSYPYCLPEVKIEYPNGSNYYMRDCNAANCVAPFFRTTYTGPYASTGTYNVYMRSAANVQRISAAPLAQLRGFLRILLNNAAVTGGTCSGGNCAVHSVISPLRSNCPNRNSGFSGWTDLSFATQIDNADTFVVSPTDYFKRLRIDINYGGDAGSICAGGVLGYTNPFSTSQHGYYARPPRNNRSVAGFSVNMSPSPWVNENTSIPIPSGNYSIVGWAENRVDYNVNYFLERLDYAKFASKSFLDQVRWKTEDKIGLIDFGTDVTQTVPLTSNVDAVKSGIDTLQASGETATGDALKTAIDALSGETSGDRFIVLLSDGQANRGSYSTLQSATLAKNNGIKIYTIGFGRDVNESELTLIAWITDGNYFFASDANQLVMVFKQIAFQVQASTKTANIVIPPVPGVTYSDYWCKTASGTLCKDNTTSGCLCNGIYQDGSGQLIFQDAQIFKQDPEWWEGQFRFAADCNGEYCKDRSLLLPPAAAYVETTDKYTTDYWPAGLPPEGAQSKVDILVNDLAIEFLEGNVNPSTGLADLNVKLSNDGNYTIVFEVTDPEPFISCTTGAPINSCTFGLSIIFYKDNLAPSNKRCGTCTDQYKLCPVNVTCNGQFSRSSVTYQVPGFEQGLWYTKINPAAAGINECALHNEDSIDCTLKTTPLYYVVEYWTWRE